MKRKRKILSLWRNPREMRKDLILDNKNQKIWNKKTGNQLKFQLSSKKKYYYTIPLYKNKKKHTLVVHQLFFFNKYGYLPSQIDHIDQNQFNNCLSNLRPSTARLNARNRKVEKSSSRHRNVNKIVRKSGLVVWQAYFHYKYKKKHLGTFRTEDEAGLAVNKEYIKRGMDKVIPLNKVYEKK